MLMIIAVFKMVIGARLFQIQTAAIMILVPLASAKSIQDTHFFPLLVASAAAPQSLLQ
jgi:hypothetical protein